MSNSQNDFCNNDRKLKPIFGNFFFSPFLKRLNFTFCHFYRFIDYLDNGFYKKAFQEIEKLLKKFKDSQYIRVLKCLTLIRMGKKKEASEILPELENEIPINEHVLQTMSMCYREMQRSKLIVYFI